MSKKSDNELKEKIGEYLSDTWEELKEDIETLPAKERAAAKLKLMDYVVSKVQAVKETGGKKSSIASILLREKTKKKDSE